MRSCVWCGVALPAPSRLSGNPRKYCSKRCSDSYHYSLKPKVGFTVRACIICGTSFMGNLPHHRFCSIDCRKDLALTKRQWPRAWNRDLEQWESDCQECGTFVSKQTAFGKIIRCDTCRGKAQQAVNRLKNTKRRGMQMKGRVTVEQLVRRDGAVCYLCDEVIDLTIPRNQPLGATVDHVMPRSRGGHDTLDNVKLAHWICNLRKSDKLIEGINA